MSYDVYEDDLGIDGGKTFFEEAPLARHLVNEWTIRSAGNRPKDHMVRDLLFGSLERDRRNWVFRKIVKEKPRWMMKGTASLPKPMQFAVLKYRALHFQHSMHLTRMNKIPDDTLSGKIGRLTRCWPTTVEVAWGGPGERSPRDLCGYARHCPFCFGRYVLEIYERLEAGPCNENSECCMLLGITSMTDGKLDEQYQNLSVEERCRFVRKKCGAAMRRAAEVQGATGGLVVFQVGPHLSEKPVWHGNERAVEAQCGYNYRISILADVPTSVAIRSYAARPAGATDIDDWLPEQDTALLDRADWHLVPPAHTGSLRRAVFGRPPSYRGGDAVQEGLFALQPWPLANFEQWRGHWEMTKNLRLFDAWGSWQELMPAPPPAEPIPRLINAPLRRGIYLGKLALRAKNRERHDEANTRCAKLLTEIQINLADFLDGRERPPGRIELRRILRARGFHISDRDCRSLAKHISIERR